MSRNGKKTTSKKAVGTTTTGASEDKPVQPYPGFEPYDVFQVYSEAGWSDYDSIRNAEEAAFALKMVRASRTGEYRIVSADKSLVKVPPALQPTKPGRKAGTKAGKQPAQPQSEAAPGATTGEQTAKEPQAAKTKGKAKKPTKGAEPAIEAATKKLSALDAAAKVLEESGEAMSVKELIEQMASKGYWTSPKRVGGVRELAARLNALSGLPPQRHSPLITLRVHRTRGGQQENTQRARSFLYAVLGAVAALQLGRRHLLYYENGVTSINLPLANSVVSTRATRTTHPQFLRAVSRFLSLYLGRPFAVENPFWDRTKTQVVEVLGRTSAAPLLANSESCSSPRLASNEQPHCGTCSQCIDRRFAVLAAGLERFDPASRYAVDLIRGERARGVEQAMLAHYVANVQRIAKLNQNGFLARYGELSRAIEPGRRPAATLTTLYQMHCDHAASVNRVLEDSMNPENRRLMVRGELPSTCLIAIVNNRKVEEEEEAGNARPGPASPAAPAAEADNVWELCGEKWRVRFRGGEVKDFNDRLGMRYLRELLSQPGVGIRAADLLAAHLDRRELPRAEGSAGGQQQFPNEPVDDLPDPQALRRYRELLELAEERLQALDREADDAAFLKLCGERDFYQKELDRANWSLKRSAAEARSDRKAVRDAVGKAIRRALKPLQKELPELHVHLLKTISFGGEPVYRPSETIVWQT